MLMRNVVLAIATAVLIAAAAGLIPFLHSNVAAQEAQTSTSSHIVRYLRESAESDRAQAAEEERQAAAWRGLADAARANAASSIDPLDAKGWLEDAAWRDASADELGKKGERLRQSADEQEQRAAELERAQQARDAPKPQPPPPTSGSGVETQQQAGESDFLRRQAVLQRKRASELQELAGRWRGAARHVQAQLPKTKQEARTAALEETATLYYAQADALDADAQERIEVAAALEARAAQLPPEKPKPESDEPIPSPEDFAGRWLTGDGDPTKSSEITIRVPEPDQQTLSLVSGQHRWFGFYDPRPEAPKGRVWFVRRPAYKQMNLEVPEWARRKLEGFLEWRLELHTEQVCGVEEFTARWFPGEVSWDEAAKRAWVSGEGNPIEIPYARGDEEVEEETGTPTIFAVSATQQDGDYRLITAIGRGLPFRLKAILPSKLGDATGSQMLALLRGAEGEAAVALAGRKLPSGAWTYLSQPVRFHPYREADVEAIRFGIYMMDRVKRALGLGVPDLGLETFAREGSDASMELETTNGEPIAIIYGEAVAGIAVYDDQRAFSISQVRRALNDLEIAQQTALLLGAVDSGGQTAVERRLAMILNARTYLNYDPGTFEDWPEHLAPMIGVQYLGLLRLPDERFQDVSTRNLGPNEQGVVFQSTLERSFVEAEIDEAVDKSFETYLDGLKRRVAAGIDDKAVIASVVPLVDPEDLKIVFFGETWEGDPVDRVTRSLAGTRLVLTVFAEVAGVHSSSVYSRMQHALRQSMKLGATAGAAGGRADDVFAKLRQIDDDNPGILEIPTRDPGMPRIEFGEPNVAKKHALLTRRYGTEKFEILKDSTQAAINHSAWAKGYCVANGCSLHSIAYVLERQGKASVFAKTLHKLVKNFEINVIKEKGMSLKGMRDILEVLYDARTSLWSTVAIGKPAGLKIIEEGLAKRKLFLTGIVYSGGEYHAIVMTRLVRDAKKGITHIEFFDMNAGAEVRMACDLFTDELWNPYIGAGTGRGYAEVLEVEF